MSSRITIILLFFTLPVIAQKDSRHQFLSFKEGGITYSISARVVIEKASVGYKVTLEDFSGAASLPNGVEFEGKVYQQWDFNNQVGQYLYKIKVKTISLRVIEKNLDCSGSLDLSFASQGSASTFACTLPKDGKLFISDLIVRDIQTEGAAEVFNFLRKAIAAQKNEVANSSSENTNSSTSNPTLKSKTDPIQDSKASKTPALVNRNPNFDNFNKPYIPVNAKPVDQTKTYADKPIPNATTYLPNSNVNGYDAKGNYVGIGTYNSSGSGTFMPVGPGKLRSDGNYDVVDRTTGKVEIVSKSDNQRLIQLQEQKAQAANYQQQQQKIQDQFKQQQQARQQQMNAQLAQQAQMNAFTDQAANAIGNLATGIGNMIANSKAKKDAEKRRQALLAEQERLRLAAIEAEKKFRYDSRVSLLANYKPGIIPGYTSKISYDILYYFIYAYDENGLSTSTLPLYVSNIVALKRASDGTWPYQRNIEEAIEPLSPYKEIFHGYYTSEEEAEIAKNGFVTMHQQIGASIYEIAYKKKNTTSASNTNTTRKQFWDTSFSVQPKEATAKKIENEKVVDPLWDVNSSVNSKISSLDTNTTSQVKKKVDFWGEEAVKPKTNEVITQEPVDQSSLNEIFNSLQQNDTKKAIELLNKFPTETNDLSLESLRAHSYLLSDQVVKALDVYKKHKGKAIAGSGILWEEKIKKDIEQLQQKGIQHQHFPLILTLMM